MTSHGSGKSHEYHRLTVISGSSNLTGIIKIPVCHIYPCHHSVRYLYNTNCARQKKSKLYLHSLALSLDKTSGARQKKSKLYLHSLALSLDKTSGARQKKSKLYLHSLALSLDKTSGARQKRASSICTHLHCLWYRVQKRHQQCGILRSIL